MRKIEFATLIFRWVAPLLVLVCAGWFVFAMGAREKPKRKKTPPGKSVAVEIIQAHPHTGTLDIVASGVVIPHREVKISARVAGEVVLKSDLLSPGQYVNEGDLLLKIDPTDYKLEISRFEKEIAKVDVDLERLGIDARNAKRLLGINKEIVELKQVEVQRHAKLRSGNALSDSENDAVKLGLLTAVEKVTENENQIQGFENQIKSLAMNRELVALQMQKAKLDLQRTEIYAPFSGVVLANHVEQNSNLANGSMVATIEDTSMVEVRCSLRADDIEFIYDSQSSPEQQKSTPYALPNVPVTIEYQRGSKTFRWAAMLSRQDGLGVDQSTRTIPVRVQVPDPAVNVPASGGEQEARQLALVRGMFVSVKLHCQPQMPLMVIPESVLRPGKTLWVKRNGQLHIEPVQIVRIEEGKAYFDLRKSSLTNSDQIIGSPVPNAKEGLAVSLKQKRTRVTEKGDKGRGKAGRKKQAAVQ